MPNDEAHREALKLLQVGRIAKEFGVLPRVVLNDMLDDPEQLSVLCLETLNYADAMAAYQSADASQQKVWHDSPMYQIVERTEFEKAERALAEAGEES